MLSGTSTQHPPKQRREGKPSEQSWHAMRSQAGTTRSGVPTNSLTFLSVPGATCVPAYPRTLMAFGGSPTRDTVWAGCIARTRYWMRNQLSVEMTAPSRIGTHADDELLGPLPGGGRVHGRLFLWLLSTCGYGCAGRGHGGHGGTTRLGVPAPGYGHRDGSGDCQRRRYSGQNGNQQPATDEDPRRCNRQLTSVSIGTGSHPHLAQDSSP